MRFFIDTANVEDIRKANDMGVIFVHICNDFCEADLHIPKNQ